jgi:1,4-alpha-glucan branching enzyme
MLVLIKVMEGDIVMSIKKPTKKKSTVCKVTFHLPKEKVASAKDIHLVGDFNSWDTKATPMKKQKDGSFSITLDLNPGQEYQYRYLIDGANWENDSNADKYVPSPFGDSENSVLIL